MKHRHQHPPLPLQRVTITLDIVDQPGNDTITIDILNDILRRLEHDTAIPPLLIRLQINIAVRPNLSLLGYIFNPELSGKSRLL